MSDSSSSNDKDINLIHVPIAWLHLNAEQRSEIRAKIGRDIDRVQLISSVEASVGDKFVPLANTAGLAGVVVHYGEGNGNKRRGSQLLSAIVQEAAVPPGAYGYFQAHSKLIAPREDADSGARGSKKSAAGSSRPSGS